MLGRSRIRGADPGPGPSGDDWRHGLSNDLPTLEMQKALNNQGFECGGSVVGASNIHQHPHTSMETPVLLASTAHHVHQRLAPSTRSSQCEHFKSILKVSSSYSGSHQPSLTPSSICLFLAAVEPASWFTFVSTPSSHTGQLYAGTLISSK